MGKDIWTHVRKFQFNLLLQCLTWREKSIKIARSLKNEINIRKMILIRKIGGADELEFDAQIISRP